MVEKVSGTSVDENENPVDDFLKDPERDASFVVKISASDQNHYWL